MLIAFERRGILGVRRGGRDIEELTWEDCLGN